MTKSPGRPKKSPTKKRSPGRPKKSPTKKRSPGRPKKSPTKKRSPGRPKKSPTKKRGPGRPKKSVRGQGSSRPYKTSLEAQDIMLRQRRTRELANRISGNIINRGISEASERARARQKKFDNKTIREAVDLHFNNPQNCYKIYGKIEYWDTSGVTNMDNLFTNSSYFWRYQKTRPYIAGEPSTRRGFFSEDLSRWNVSNVKSMRSMFDGCILFNSDLSRWNVSNVEYMSRMFYKCEFFNSNISNWDVRKVKDMSYMFAYAKSFDQNLNSWQVQFGTKIEHAFDGSGVFKDRPSGVPVKWYRTGATVRSSYMK